ncbi:MAG TPA: transglycosylase family protein [Mycobacteriales bacterium]|nr:transglycosylase family protein [Mycobacteriales bacterium]
MRKQHRLKASLAMLTLSAGLLAASSLIGAAPVQAWSYWDEPPTAENLEALRWCESTNDYAADTGNGYYGAYQFDLRTWRGRGYSGYPHQAAPATQDKAAHELQADRGWSPWPACARKLGLSDSRASRSGGRTVVVGKPVFTQPLTKQLVSQKRADVRAWQARMQQRGWDIKVDGRFGPRSARVAARFAAEKSIKVAPGTVDRAMWHAAWAMPVT